MARSIALQHSARGRVAVSLAALVVSVVLLDCAPLWLGLAYLVMSPITFFAYRADKRASETGAWRISEAKLHGLDLTFGIAGGLVAQQVFRHKTSKQPYGLITWCIAATHIALLAALLVAPMLRP